MQSGAAMLEVYHDQWRYIVRNLEEGFFKIEFWKGNKFLGFGLVNVQTNATYHWPKGLRVCHQIIPLKAAKLVDAGYLKQASWVYDDAYAEECLELIHAE